MGRSIAILSGLAAIMALTLLPPKMVRYRACCYGPGVIPGVTCCGRRHSASNEPQITAHRSCCDPYVFVAANVVGDLAQAHANVPLGPVLETPVHDAFASTLSARLLQPIPQQTGPPPRDILTQYVRLNT